MVCWQVNIMAVEFKAKNIELLKEAIEQVFNKEINTKILYDDNILYINSSTYIDLKNGQITFPNYYSKKVNELKRVYAMKAVEKIAKKKRFVIKKNGLQMQVRRF